MSEEEFIPLVSQLETDKPNESQNKQKHKKSKYDDGLDHQKLFVRQIPLDATSEELSDYFAQFAPVKGAVVVKDGESNSRGFGFVTFDLDEDTQAALEKSRKQKFKNRVLIVDLAKRRNRNGEGERAPVVSKEEVEKRRARLIIRNLPWSIRQPEQLKQIFQKYGAVTDVIIPRKNGGRMSGFAFVTMKKLSTAQKAIKQSEGLKIDGREVAVDFAVEKSKWEKIQQDELDDKEELSLSGDLLSEDENEDEASEDEDEDEDEEDSGLEDEEMEEASDLEEDFESRPNKNKQENYSIFVRNIPYDATDESLKEHFEQFGAVKYALPVTDRETGLAKGTAFVAFYNESTYNDVLENAPEQLATSVLIADDVSPLYVYEGRVLSIAPTVDRESAGRLQEKNSEKRRELLGKLPGEKDKRNLFLLNEGRITSSSKLAALISQTDMEVREKSYNLRVQQLNKNPTLHISLTRLAIRNLPRAMILKSLKQLGRKAVLEFAKEVKEGLRHPLSKEELNRSTKHREFVGDLVNGVESNKTKKKGVVRQAKIITEVKGSGEAGRSRGYGFLEFKDHRTALMALRWLNAHEVTKQEIFEPLTEEEKKLVLFDDSTKRRLIVEFAIENAQVVKRRMEKVSESRKQKSDAPAEESKKRKRDQNNDDKDESATDSKKKLKRPSYKKGNMNKTAKASKLDTKTEDSKAPKVSEDVKQIIAQKRKRRQQKGK